MAIVRNAQRLLEAAIDATLADLTDSFGDGLDVVYHLAAVPSLSVDEDDHTMTQTLMWRLNLFITYEGKYISLFDGLPYHHCSDGDTLPMVEMVENLWDAYRFGYLMMEGHLDCDLEKVAETIGSGAETPTEAPAETPED